MSEGIRHEALKRAFYKGSISWIGAQIFVRVINFFAGIALARWLAPEDFGLMSLGLTVTTLIALFGNVGIGHYLIYHPEERPEVLTAGFWLGVIVSLGLFAFQAAVAPPIAEFYGRPDLVPILLTLGLTLLIAPWGSVHAALLRRRLEIGKLVLPQVVATLIGTGIGLVLARWGAGVWSLVVPFVLAALITAALNWKLSPWRPAPHWSRRSWREIVRYGRHVLGNDLTAYAMQNADYILIGRWMGASPLGYYTFAYNQSLMLPTLFMGVFSHVVFPIFARLRERSDELRAAYFRFARTSAGIAIPPLLLLIVAAPEYVRVIYGEKWTPAVLPLQLLLLHAVGRCLMLGAGELFNAIGRPDLNFKCSLAAVPVFVVAVAMSLRWGIVGVAAATALIFLSLSGVVTAIALRTLRWKLADLWTALSPVGLGAGGVLLVTWLLRQASESLALPEWQTLLALFLGGGIVYALALALLLRPELRELKDLVVPRRTAPIEQASVSDR
ncbi:MAG: lipopolysaccharide biosynthesis protein [Blastocatellia bacterium]|nr:lipopolysaccharide biosynthesis protein [Blastocatellia bacterium]MCS7157695.1 lipopolysaccharide biosynthesis protein [Blastocatellia bacterium]MCX7751960.1 lipopolysaccharide biosynthesis protein [Blastocatellia bacterium]MDW8167066.1 lipopolysaccharide biosynthesis protein [Acidobacteriota bacterium]MDW8257170.1 lipopolysaccharide biosynthesis protein [Acidobacteriota bacterium]